MSTEVPAAVATLLAAANNNDTAAFLDSLTPDGVVDDWGREFRGPDAIRGWSDAEFIGSRSASRSPMWSSATRRPW